MPKYAAKTEVRVEKSRSEIEAVVVKYGASEFVSGWKSGAAMVGFRLNGLSIRFVLPIPSKTDKAFTTVMRRGSLYKASEQQATEQYEQELRRRWRALYLVIKAKLEAVESGISTIEEEFMAHIVMPNDMTVGQFIIHNAMADLRANRMPAIAGPKSDVVDAEIVP